MSLKFLKAKQKIEVRGEFTYNFELEVKYEETNISAFIAKATNASNIPILMECKWKRITGDRTYLIPGITSNAYQPTCEDIGSCIAVEASPVDPHDGQGTAEAVCGQLTLDPNIRKNLEYILSSGTSKFTLYYSSDLLDHLARNDEAVLEINQTMLKLEVYQRDGTLDTGNSFSTSYSIDYPKIILHHSDSKKLIFILNEGVAAINETEELPYNRKMSVQCMSRQNRDLIVMTVRAFAVRNYLIHSKAIDGMFSQELPRNTSIDYAVELEIALNELNNLASENFELNKDKKRQKRELKALEGEMKETIEAYQTMLNYQNEGGKETELSEEIEKLKNELNIAIVNKQKLRKKVQEKEEEIKDLRKENEMLKEKQIGAEKELEMKIVKEQDLEKYEEMEKKMSTQIEFTSQELEILNAKVSKYQEKIKNLKNALGEMQKKNEILEEQNKELGKEKTAQQEIAKLKQENEALLGQRSILSKKIGSLEEELEKLENELESEKESHSQTKKMYEELNKNIQEENKQEEPIRNDNEIEELRNALKSTEEEALKYRQQCDSLSAQLSRAQAAARKKNGSLMS
ncbi:unnamed protein product [Blepharisma stoltei]|uniref:Uncharacterized protein n=1 Tax=Blepharisma stoltei TaxID=1481888 RepID=A0AAU9JDN4_9CILI|nr:unnamed protein product [Blepharisma stoltei]